MHTTSNRFSWLFLVLILSTMLALAPTAHAAGPSALLPPGGKYTVRANDTLWDIAMGHGISVAQLTAANPGVNPGALRPGQTLSIPSSEQTPVSGHTYAVRPDDTLWDIATNYGLTVDDLLAANPGVDPRRLMVGQELQVPGPPPPAPVAPPPAEDATTVPAPAPEAAPEAAPAAESAPEPAPEPAPVAAPGINPMAQAMLDLINAKRTAGGRPALAWNAQLAAAAQAHADDCAARNRGSHVGSDGARLAARLQRVGYAPVWSGENWANARSVERAMALWWNEPPGADPHVQNIMAGRATDVGIGVALGAWGYYFIADFGSR